jgi:hypothetical protein
VFAPSPALANPSPTPARPNTAAPFHLSDFDVVAPDPEFARQEQPASTSWVGGPLPFIPAESTLPFVDLPGKLIELIDHCWKSGSAPTQIPRAGQFQIGAGARTGHVPGIKNALLNGSSPEGTLRGVELRNADYRKQEHPLSDVARGTAPHLRSIVPNDWKVTLQLQRVSAYTFRGDKRGPKDVRGHGGFNPPITRTDQYYVDNVMYDQFNSYMRRRFGFTQGIPKDVFDRAYKKACTSPDDRMVMQNFCVWRSMVENEAYHLGRMMFKEALKGYISTTRAVTVAKGFARGNGGPGWVYLTQICGGFLVPEKGTHEWTQSWGEQEIALPRPIPWDLVFACRETRSAGTFTGPIYMRRGFATRNAHAYKEAFELLSGRVQ